jgi:pimeloyl-ACP methyl ester carboxylesterase
VELKVQGARAFVEVVGDGPPLLMLHGNPDTHAIWRSLVDRLKDRFRCITPDLPGFGRSEEPIGYDASLASRATYVEELVDAIGITEPVFLAVHDMGGGYGLAWMCEHPERVRKIAITNTSFHASYRWHPWGRVWRTPGLGELSMLFMNRRIFARELRHSSRKLTQRAIDDAYDAITPATKRAALRYYRASDPPLFAPWEARLRAIVPERVPAIVLWGEHDPFIPGEFADRFGAAEVYRFPESGHWVIAEEPDVVAARMRAFFDHPESGQGERRGGRT